MTNKEMNEFLAERLFGLDKSNVSQSDKERGTIYKAKPDYTENYQPVLEKMIESNAMKIELCQTANGVYDCIVVVYKDSRQYCGFYGRGDTLGEAICRAAVEYLRLEVVNEQTSNA